MPNFSVCIVAREEASNIRGCLDACLPFLPEGTEVVLMDGGSTDGTPELVERYYPEVKVNRVKQNWDLRMWENEAAYRNLAWSRCQNDWVLSLDADEAYSKEFYAAIPSLLVQQKRAYYVPTVNFYGSTKRAANPYLFPDYHVRLANRQNFRWVGMIHSSLWLSGKFPIYPDHWCAEVLPFFLYHYARATGDVDRPYGKFEEKNLCDFIGPHPRREFDAR